VEFLAHFLDSHVIVVNNLVMCGSSQYYGCRTLQQFVQKIMDVNWVFIKFAAGEIFYPSKIIKNAKHFYNANIFPPKCEPIRLIDYSFLQAK